MSNTQFSNYHIDFKIIYVFSQNLFVHYFVHFTFLKKYFKDIFSLFNNLTLFPSRIVIVHYLSNDPNFSLHFLFSINSVHTAFTARTWACRRDGFESTRCGDGKTLSRFASSSLLARFLSKITFFQQQ